MGICWSEPPVATPVSTHVATPVKNTAPVPVAQPVYAYAYPSQAVNDYKNPQYMYPPQQYPPQQYPPQEQPYPPQQYPPHQMYYVQPQQQQQQRGIGTVGAVLGGMIVGSVISDMMDPDY